MKTFRFLTMAVIALLAGGFLQSCSDDDDGPGGSASDLIGLWEQTHVTNREKVNGQIVYEEDEDCDGSFRIELLEDGTIKEWSQSSSGSWRPQDSGTWRYSKGKLYADWGDGEEAVNVTTLTSTTCTFEVSAKETYEGVTYEYYSKQTYRKVSEEWGN